MQAKYSVLPRFAFLLNREVTSRAFRVQMVPLFVTPADQRERRGASPYQKD